MFIIGIAIALILMFIGEKLENDTKKEYMAKGFNWDKVLLYSNLAGVLSGLVSFAIIHFSSIPITLNTYFLVFATTITAYVTMQSILTDFKILLINRKILRIAYVSIYIISIINVLTNESYRYNWSGLLLFTGLLIFMFIFSSIGSSDVRLLAVGIPYAVSINGYTGIFLLIVTLLLVAAGMYIKRLIYIKKQLPDYKEKYPDMLKEMGELKFLVFIGKIIMRELNTDEKHAVPVGPFMIMPFLVYLMIYPLFV